MKARYDPTSGRLDPGRAARRPLIPYARAGDARSRRPLVMASDPKQTARPESALVARRDQGIRIFTYPKTIFIFPTLVVALICGIGMQMIGDRTEDPIKIEAVAQATAGEHPSVAPTSVPMAKHQRFVTPQNLLGILFL